MAIENFIRTFDKGDENDSNNYILQNAKKIEELLDNVKICDPAIGSGAFPMGLLQMIYRAKMTLDWTLDPAEVKRSIIQNSIYGVDIEKGAVDIARLRFWLSLIVDEKAPQPLPNLDYKIMQGNSLLESFEGVDLKFDHQQFKTIVYEPDLDIFGKPIKSQVSITDYLKTSEGTDQFDVEKLEKEYFNTHDTDKKNKLKAELDQFERSFISDCLNRKYNELNNEIAILEKKVTGITAKAKVSKLSKLNKEKEHISDSRTKLKNMSFDDKPYFLWHLYFMDVFKNGGFDIVIANPPYLRIQGLRKTDSKYAEELINLYETATGAFDLYILFTERGLLLLKDLGIMNYIMPVKWTNSAFGNGIREFLSLHDYSVSKIISFNEYQVFNASTYSGLHWFFKGKSNLSYLGLKNDLPNINSLENFIYSIADDDYSLIKSNKLKGSVWTLAEEKVFNLLDKIRLQEFKIKDIFSNIFQGIATSRDSIYFIHDCREIDNCIIGFSKELGKEVKLEKDLVKPLLKGENIKKYKNLTSDLYVLFPYKAGEVKPKLFSLDELKNKYPFCYNYLKENENVLRNRERGKLIDDEDWYRYIYPKNINLFENEKIITAEISLGPNLTIDEKGIYYHNTKCYSLLKNPMIKEELKYFLGILNSSMLWFYLKNTGYVLRGGYFTFKTNYLNHFPIPIGIDEILHNKIISNVNQILTAKIANPQADTTSLETEIDQLVYKLYGLTDEEIKIVEESV